MKRNTVVAILLILNISLFSQEKSAEIIKKHTNTKWLLKNAKILNQSYSTKQIEIIKQAKNKKWPIRTVTSEGISLEVKDIINNKPIYYQTYNSNAAKTISVDKVWSNGSLGLSLDGTGITVGEWDAGVAYPTHQEYFSRINIKDSNGDIHYHATHVAGTIISQGIDPNAKGMAYNSRLDSYDWNNDGSEMSNAAANGLLLSNHSYGTLNGWIYNFFNDGKWAWFGSPSISETEDVGFGAYTPASALRDAIAFNAPYYLIVQAAGNDRDDFGPANGTEHWAWDFHDWRLSTKTRNPDGEYDCIPAEGISKNTLTVGAVEDIPSGYNSINDVVQSSFSSWGPADDGRIKPDLVANGVNLYSTSNSGTDSYIELSGTSMAAPSVTGALALLQQHYYNSQLSYLKASTLKALVIHTADESGPNLGPDYMNGWGLLNTGKASEIISSNTLENPIIQESVISNQQSFSIPFTHDGSGTIKLTMVWTDPAGHPDRIILNDRTPFLINDLDIRITRVSDSEVFYPWKLDPNNPEQQAFTGDNKVDNVEQIYIETTNAGEYVVEITHKGFLENNMQEFSLIISGITLNKYLKNISLLTPNGDESVKIGANYKIKWVSSKDIKNIKLEYTTDYNSSSTWHSIETELSSSAGQYLWTIPDIISTNCKVRIIDNLDPSIYDESDNTFKIRRVGVVFETESNNKASFADPISYGDTVHASINIEDDVDYFKFNASIGDTVEIYGEERNASNLRAWLMLFDENGNLLEASSQYKSDWNNPNQRIVYEISTTGSYYIRYSNDFDYYPNNAGESEEDKISSKKHISENSIIGDQIQNTTGDYFLIVDKYKPSAPQIFHYGINFINYNSAIIMGQIFPNGLETTVEYEYGLTQSYGNSAGYNTTFNGIQQIILPALKIDNLASNTRYNSRIKVTNSLGTIYGQNEFFRTPEIPEKWFHQESNIENALDVFFIDSNIGWAVGDYGAIIRTLNGGKTWLREYSQTENSLHSVFFIDSLNGWAVGVYGAIIHTTDGGITWFNQESGTSEFLNDVFFFNKTIGWIALDNYLGQGSRILRTNDGGKTWEGQSTGTEGSFNDVEFVDSLNGWAVGSFGMIISTTDGGNTWESQNSGTSDWLFAVSFINTLEGWAVGDMGTVLKTENGGSNWEMIDLRDWLSDVYFLDALNGLAIGGGGKIFSTTDGGNSWKTEKSGTNSGLSALSVVDIHTATIVGGSLIIHKELAKPIVNLQSPENNIELSDTSTNIEFTWSSDELVDGYNLEASTSESFDSLIISVSHLTETSYIYSTEFLPGIYYWRVNAQNQAGTGDWSEIYTINVTLTDVDEDENQIPSDFVLHQNYPNPFNPSTLIKYGLPEESNIKIEIFNMLGQSVGILVNTDKSAGYFEVTWKSKILPSGIYLISIKAQGLRSKKNFMQVKKALLLK